MTAAAHDDAIARESVGGSRLFRAVNERIRALEGDRAFGHYDFVCECGDESCTSVMRMTAEQYASVRAAVNQFAVLPGHERTEDEVVIVRAIGHVIVVKRAVDRAGAPALRVART